MHTPDEQSDEGSRQLAMPSASTGVWDLGLTSSPWSLPQFSDSVPYELSSTANLAQQVAAKFSIQAHALGMGFFSEFSGVLNTVDDQWTHYVDMMTPTVSQTKTSMALCFEETGQIHVCFENALTNDQILNIKLLSGLLNTAHDGLGWWVIHHLVQADPNICMVLTPEVALQECAYFLNTPDMTDEEYLQETMERYYYPDDDSEFNALLIKIENNEASEDERNLFLDKYGYGHRPSFLKEELVSDQKWLINEGIAPPCLPDEEIQQLDLPEEEKAIVEGVFRLKQVLKKNHLILDAIKKYTEFDDECYKFGWTWVLYWGERSIDILTDILDQYHEQILQSGGNYLSFQFELTPKIENEIPTDIQLRDFISMLHGFIEIHSAYENLISRSIRYTHHV